MIAARDRFGGVVAEFEEKLGGAGEHGAKRQVFVLGDEDAVAGSQDAQQAEADLRVALEQAGKSGLFDLPEQAVLGGDGGDRVGAVVQHSDFIEHDDRVDDHQDVLLPGRAEAAQVHLPGEQHEHAGARIVLQEDHLAGIETAHLPGLHDVEQVSGGQVLKMRDLPQSFGEFFDAPFHNSLQSMLDLHQERWLDGAEPFDALADNGKTVIPEFALADIDAKSLAQVGGAGFAGAGEQVLVVGHEGIAALLVDGVQADAEEQSEGVGEVVEGKPGVVVMRLPGPHIFVQVALVQAVAVGGFLGLFHQVAQVIGAELGFGALLEDVFLEQVAGVDIHDDLGVVDQHGFEHRELVLRVAELLQDGLHDDGLASDGGGLGQGHGGTALQGGFASPVGAVIVVSVAEFVGDGGDLGQGAIEVAQDARLLHAADAHAEGAAALAGALLGVDPVLVEGAVGEIRQVAGEAGEVIDDESAPFFEGIAGFALTERGVDIPPGQFFLAEAGGFGLQVFAEDGEGIVHGVEHGLQALAVHAGIVDGAVQGVFTAAALVEGVDGTFDAVHAGRQRLTHGVEGLHLSFIGAPPDALVGVRVQVDQGGQRQFLHFAFQFEIDGHLGGDGALQAAPGAGAADVELGCQAFFGFTHQVAALLGDLAQGEGVRLGDRMGGDGAFEDRAELTDPGLEARR